MPWWPFARMPHNSVRPTNPPTFALEQRANAAFFARRWTESECLFLEVMTKADLEGRQVARNMLGQIYEHQGRIDDALAMYEANLTERSPFISYVKRLAILYHRLGRPDDELRVLLVGSQSVANTKFGQWCRDRLWKLK
jgi:tetratricopeptide (TPR) repeat protein